MVRAIKKMCSFFFTCWVLIRIPGEHVDCLIGIKIIMSNKNGPWLQKFVQFYAIYMLEIRRKRMGKTCQGSGFITLR